MLWVVVGWLCFVVVCFSYVVFCLCSCLGFGFSWVCLRWLGLLWVGLVVGFDVLCVAVVV